MKNWLSATFVISVLVFSGCAHAISDFRHKAADWLTVAESSRFQETGSYRQTMEFLQRIAEATDSIRVKPFGRSASGRSLPLVIASKDRCFEPSCARQSNKPIVLIQNCIHAGEVDGKDASLMLLRDLVLGQYPDLLEAAILLIIPFYNADGHERVSRFNRPNQDGPAQGMGFRTTTNGRDLNRDFMKVDTQEAQALMALFNAWRPHLHVDNHVTDGVDHDWVLTWATTEKPVLAPTIDRWRHANLTKVFATLNKQGFRSGPYVYLNDREDPSKGFSSMSSSPRYSTGYFALRNRLSILIETHSYKPFKQRVLATHAFLVALIRQVGKSAAALTQAVAKAEERTVALGRAKAANSKITLRWETDPTSDLVQLPIYQWSHQDSLVTGKPLLRYKRGQIAQIEVPWSHRARPAKETDRPRGYLVLPGWPAIEKRLAVHGIRTHRLTKKLRLAVQTFRVAQPKFQEQSYQGRVQVEATITRHLEERTLPVNSIWVPADQPDFEVAVQLLEPQAPDSLFSWGLLSIVFERKEYIDLRVLEQHALALVKQPEIKKAWEQALQDESFANDWRKRYLWWYQRTPYWDKQVGLLPIMRLNQALHI